MAPPVNLMPTISVIAPPVPDDGRIIVEYETVEDSAVQTAVFWLAAQAERTGLDAVIVVPTLNAATCLSGALPNHSLNELIDGNLIRFNRGSLLLMTPPEVMPQARRHHVVLAIGLADRELARVERMNPAALCVLRRTGPASARSLEPFRLPCST